MKDRKVHCSPLTPILMCKHPAATRVQRKLFSRLVFLTATLVKLARIRAHRGGFYPLKCRMSVWGFFCLRWSLFASVNLYGSGSGLNSSWQSKYIQTTVFHLHVVASLLVLHPKCNTLRNVTWLQMEKTFKYLAFWSFYWIQQHAFCTIFMLQNTEDNLNLCITALIHGGCHFHHDLPHAVSCLAGGYLQRAPFGGLCRWFKQHHPTAAGGKCCCCHG